MATAGTRGIGKYVVVYVCLLVAVAAQFLVGFQNTGGLHLVVRILTFGAVETVLVVFFLMNLSLEKRNFLQFFVFFMLFVLAAMNYIWTDSFRLLVFRLTGFGPS